MIEDARTGSEPAAASGRAEQSVAGARASSGRPVTEPRRSPTSDPSARNGGDPVSQEEGVVDVLPGLIRIAGGAWLRTATWALTEYLRFTARILRAARSPEEAVELVYEVGGGLRTYARELLGIAELDERVMQLMPAGSRSGPGSSMAARARAVNRDQPDQLAPTLREQGAALLRESADVTFEDAAHPAYARILTELAPDEARILRLLMLDGPQPAVDVRAANLIGVGSQLVAQGLNMIGAQAGVRHLDRVPAYLNNLNRLGLIWFSREALDNPMRYQVIEAQPEAIDAIRRAGRAKTVHRSIHPTPFGKDFCEVCLPLETAASPDPDGTVPAVQANQSAERSAK